MPEKQPSQQSYLLRLWPEDAQWRASLQQVATNERVGFADLQSLFLFLQAQTGISDKKNSTGVSNENECPPTSSESE